MPGLDEAGTLEPSADVVFAVASRLCSDFELIIVNDGSSDGMGDVADRIAAGHGNVRVLHNPVSAGFGAAVEQGVGVAQYGYVTYVDSKGATTEETLERMVRHIGQADLVIPFPVNQSERPVSRRIISGGFQCAVNLLFDLGIRYYNHLVVYPTEMARSVRVRTRSYAFQAERVVKLLKSGATYVEVPVVDRFDVPPERKSRAFTLRNALGVLAFFVRTCYDIYGGGSGQRVSNMRRRER